MIIKFSQSQKNLKLDELINSVLDESSYLAALKEGEEGSKPENISRVENLSSFVNSATEFSSLNPDATLDDFLSNVALITDLDTVEEEESKVSMMTVHTAKGLEFPVVFITGMEEGLFPHANSMAERETLEEERRACYVAITRAEKLLYMTAACERKTFGRTYDSSMSRFMKEIPLDCLKSFSERHSGGALYGKSAAAQRAHNLYLKERGLSLPSSEDKNKNALSAPKKIERPAVNWQVGDKVQHKKWGLGTVMSVDETNVTIHFSNPEFGDKTLRSRVAPIEKV